MKETHIPIGPLLAAIGGVLLIVSLGMDWYGDRSAFTTFEVLDLVLLLLALVTLVLLAEAVGLLRGPFRSGTGLVVGATALLIVLTQLINHPPAGINLDEGTGLWLGLGGAALMLAGAVLATARVAISVEPRGRGATVTTAAPPPSPPPDDEPTIRSEPPPRP
jgi:hypothetical protein